MSGAGALPRFVRGDVDGFFGLALDNLVQLLLIDALCRTVLGFPPALLYGRILPGAAVSLSSATCSTPGRRASWRRRTGRADVCALPYGINTVSLFAHVFLVMLPAKLAAEAAGAADPVADRLAGRTGRLLASGLIELARRAGRRARAPGHAARRPALHAGRHRTRLHLARLPLPHLRATRSSG